MTERQVKQETLHLLRSTNREGIEGVICYLNGSDFFRAHCHSHHREAGGLAQHSLEACQFALAHSNGLPRDSVIIGTLLHDLCSSHRHDTHGIRGHGCRSVGILRDICGLKLSKEESDAIRLHMHGRAPEMRTNRLARLVWLADKVSAGNWVRLDENKLARIQ